MNGHITPRLASFTISSSVTHGVGADQHGTQGASQVEGTQRLFLPVALLLKQSRGA